MRKQIPFNESGIMLVEVLAAIVITSMFTLLIFSNLLTGMESYKNVNNQVSLHDEANYVMSMFVNDIYVGTKVLQENTAGGNSIVEVTDRNGHKVTLGFQNGNAVINGNAVNSSAFHFEMGESEMKVDNTNNVVEIKMMIQDETGKELELTNKVSFVNVE